MKAKWQSWNENNNDIERLVQSLHDWYPNLRQQFSKYKTFEDRVQFVVQNQQRLESLANERNAPRICDVVQLRVAIEQCAKQIHNSTAYIFQRLSQLVASTNLNEFKWNSGMITGCVCLLIEF